VNGKLLGEEAGWKMLRIYGKPYDRGFAHGFLLKKDLKRVLRTLPFLVEELMHIKFSEYLKKSNKLIKPQVIKHFPEYYQELQGISAGAQRAGLTISTDFLIAWNSHMSLSYDFNKKPNDHCSAFIATGNATKNGDIVMAHNTHTDFASGQLFNIIMQIDPEDGHSFVMQTSAGLIASVTDWFICSTGIIGNETTISEINYLPKFGAPFFCRIRQAMQYGESLDDYVKIMLKNNAGDYACSWQFGDTRTNEVMLFEIGLKNHSVQRTKNGVFYGMNSATNDDFRKKETDDVDHDNISTSVGSRNHRLDELLNHKYYGKINLEVAKQVMSDHYDMLLKKDNPGIRTVCKHLESSMEHCKRPPFMPSGCTDAKVVNTELARNNSFWGRFGSGCGRKFSAKSHIKEHPEFKDWKNVLEDFKGEKWIKIAI
jgi:hypothetical protein